MADLAEIKKKVVDHIRSCDDLFYKDHEFAYQQVRLLALELMDELATREEINERS